MPAKNLIRDSLRFTIYDLRLINSNWQKGAIRISKKLLITYLITFMVLSGTGLVFLFNPWSVQETEAAWFNDNWAYRKEVPITANAAADTDAFFSFTLDTASLITAGQLQSSCQDIRVTDQSGNILPYHVGRTNACNNAATTIDALAPYAPNSSTPTLPAGASTYYVYYGNPSAASDDQGAFSQSEAASYTVGTLGSEVKGAAPLAFWKFDDTTGTNANDSTVNNYDGTISGATWRAEDLCVSGKCLSFDGSNDVVDAGDINALDGINKMTVSLWFKQNGLAVNKGLVAKADYQTQDSWALQTDNNNSDELRIFIFNHISSDDGSNWIGTTDANLVSGTWYHVTMVYDGTQSNASRVKFYINGQERATTVGGTIPTSLTSATSTVKIGKFGGTLDRYWNGSIDEVKIYTQALTAAQAAASYNSRQNPEGVSAQLGNNTQNLPGALSSGLIGYWKLEETSTPSLDSSGSGGSGTWNGNTAAVAGKFGNGTTFDGTGDNVNVPNATATELTAGVTMSAWIKTSTSGGNIITKVWGQVGANYPGYALGLGSGSHGSGNCSSGIAGIWIGGGSNTWVCGSTSLTDGNWHHVVGTYDGTTAKVYVDTVLDGSGARTNGININVDTQIGEFYTGVIDEARIYHRALNNAEVTQLYRWAPGPAAYWKMNEKTGTTITDSSGNANTSSAFSGNVAFAQGKYDGGLAFDGTDDVVQVTESSSTDLGITGQSMTVGAWIKTTADTATNQYIVGKNDVSGAYPFVLYLDFNEHVCFATYDGSADGNICSAITINDGKWHYLTGVRNTVLDKVVIYIDGALIAGNTDSTTGSVANNDDISIGNGSTSYTQYDFNGVIDEVKIYNYLRTDAQITEDMNTGHPAPGSPVSSAIGYYRFDDGYGTTAGNSGSCGTTCNGTLTQMSSPATSTSGWNTSGKFGKALNFDGTNDYVDLGNSILLKTTLEVTISGWFKLNSDYTSTQAIVSNADSGGGNCAYHVEFGRTDNKLTWLNNCGSIDATSSRSISDNNWHHFAAVRSGVTGNWTITFYIDGLLDSTTTGITVNPQDPTENTAIGRTGSFNSQYFNGSLDEIKIFGGALTADQVKLDMNRGASQVMGALSASSNEQPNSAASEYCPPDSSVAVCTKPVGEWKFDEGSGTSANDTSGGGSTGTISGATFVNGKNNKGLNFAGGSDAVTVTNSLSTRTVEFWVNPSTTTENLIDLRTAATAASISVSGGTIAATGFTSPTIYVNGKVSSTLVAGRWQHVTITTGTTITASAIRFGRISSTSLNGKLDQIRIFDYARSQAQVAWDYNKGLPLVWYKMDECQGTTLNDMSGNSNTATLTIGATGSNTTPGTCTSSGAWFDGLIGKRNYSLDFDGTDDYAASSSTIDLSGTGVVTVSIWLKWTSYATDNDLALEFSSDTGAVTTGFYLDPNATGGVFQAFLRGNAGFNGAEFTRPSANEWHNIVVIFDKSQAAAFEITPFVDGKQVSYSKSNSTNSGNPFGNHTLYLMSRGGTTLFGSGQLDDVRIYNYPLTSTQIKQLYNDGSTRFGPSTGAP